MHIHVDEPLVDDLLILSHASFLCFNVAFVFILSLG